MKKLRNLGRSLSKVEQKRIMGGNYGDPDCDCNSNDDCSDGKTCQNACGAVIDDPPQQGKKYGVCQAKQ